MKQDFDRIYRVLAYIISNQEKTVADITSINAAVANLTTAVNALEAKLSNQAPSILQSDLDPVMTALESLTASINSMLAPPPTP